MCALGTAAYFGCWQIIDRMHRWPPPDWICYLAQAALVVAILGLMIAMVSGAVWLWGKLLKS
jgi:hypothetical protein